MFRRPTGPIPQQGFQIYDSEEPLIQSLEDKAKTDGQLSPEELALLGERQVDGFFRRLEGYFSRKNEREG